ncbi:MAG: hypothetical protein SFU87_16115 [Chitinophagaceae bacterium]|nr:hypothetical protein [Chitinophagaceae bacterium]
MKLFLIAFLFILAVSAASGQSSTLYNLNFPGLDSDTIRLNNYQGKKVIVVEFHAGQPDIQNLLFLDTLYRNHAAQIVVIAVPVDDFGTPMSSAALRNLLRDTLQVIFPVAGISKAKKQNGSNQHELLKWLTHKSQNWRFDADVTVSGEVYVVNENGVLFATLKQQTAQQQSSLLQELINLQVN